MAACCCSLAGTAACRTCSYNPNADMPPPVRSYTTIATNGVLATWKTNADKVRQMSDEELAAFLISETDSYLNSRGDYWLEWLKQEVESDD